MTPAQIEAKHRLAVIERIGQLDRKFRYWKREIDELAALKKDAATWPAGDPGDIPVVYRGRNWELEYSVRALDRKITDMGGVMNALGQDEFLQRCTFALCTLDVLVPAAAEMGLLKETPHAGARRVEIRRRERKLKAAA